MDAAASVDTDIASHEDVDETGRSVEDSEAVALGIDLTGIVTIRECDQTKNNQIRSSLEKFTDYEKGLIYKFSSRILEILSLGTNNDV